MALCLWVIGMIALVYQTRMLIIRSEEARVEALRVGQRLTDDLVQQLDARLEQIRQRGQRLVADLEKNQLRHEGSGDVASGQTPRGNGPGDPGHKAEPPQSVPSRASLAKRLEQDSKAEPFLSGVAVAFQPYTYSAKQRLYAPFYDKRKGQITQLEESYDYTAREQFDRCRWFLEPVLYREPMWTTGYGQGLGSQYADYDLPFFRTNPMTGTRQVWGTVNMTIALDELTRFLNKRNIGRLGGGYLINQEGRVLVDPTGEFIRSGTTLVEIAAQEGDKKLEQAARRMVAGAEGVIFRKDQQTGQRTYLFYRPIPTTGWSLGVLVFQGEVSYHTRELRRRQIALILTVLVFTVVTLILVTRAYHLDESDLWINVILFSVGSVLAIGCIWILAATHGWQEGQQEKRENQFAITDHKSLDTFVEKRKELAVEANARPPLVVPTGIFVRSIEFGTSSDVQLSGQVWQKYTRGIHDKIKRGFTFPEVAPDPEAVDISEAYRRKEGNVETIGWNFRVMLREKFDYSAYPFDRHRLSLQLRHVDEEHEVLLTPDLNAYQMINTRARPGLHESLVLPEWSIDGSSFSYQIVHYNTDFGVNRQPRPEGLPELQFDVLIARKPLTPFLSHIFPDMIVAVLLFGVLISASLSEQRMSVSGFTGFGVLEVCAAFFFAVILLHIDLRRGLASDTITYMEWIYLILYLILLLVAVNSVVLTTSDAVALIEYRDNLLAKVLYWPVLLGLVLVATTMVFF